MANLSINEIKTFITKHPPVIGNKFGIQISNPDTLESTKTVNLSCANVSLPGRTFSTNPQTGIPGPDIKYPYQVAYEDAIFSFLTTDNLLQREYFETWMDTINIRPNNDYGYSKFMFPITYQKKIQIFTLNETGNPNYIAELQNAYPIGIQASELSHANEAIMLTNVTITYSHYI